MSLPIYDRYQRAKAWLKLLFVPGRVVQVPELNEMQSALVDNSRQGFNVLFADGAIVKGLEVTISEINPNQAIVAAGQIYAFGYFIDVPTTTVTIQGLSEEKIGVKLVETVVTEEQDADLTDPVTGAKNKGSAGAYRLVYEPEVVVDDPAAFTIQILQFGKPLDKPETPEFDSLLKVLARRTNEESGSYLVVPPEDSFAVEQIVMPTTQDYLKDFAGQSLDDMLKSVKLPPRSLAEIGNDQAVRDRLISDTQTLTIKAGIAYVEGFRVQNQVSVKRLIAKALDTEVVAPGVEQPDLSGFGTHTSGTPLTVTLANKPLKSINNVVAPIRKTITVARDPFNAFDTIAQPGGINFPLESVTYGANTYVAGTDFTASGVTITWLNPTNFPAQAPNPGQNYQITLNYNQSLTVGADVAITDAGAGEITLAGTVGGNPVQYYTGAGANISLGYQWYLDRVDTVSLDKDGRIVVDRGQPNRFPVPQPINASQLILATVKLKGNAAADTALVTNIRLIRYTMKEIGDLVKRLERAEYNQAITNLNTEARLGVADPTILKGILTDSFLNQEKMAFDSTTFTVEGKKPVTFGDGEITPAARDHIVSLSLDLASSVYIMQPSADSKTYVPEFTVADISDSAGRGKQLKASSAIKVNAYAAYTQTPEIELTPQETSVFLESGVITVPTSNGGSPVTIPVDALSASLINSNQADTSAAQNVVFENLSRFIGARNPGLRNNNRPPIRISGAFFSANENNLGTVIDGVAVTTRPSGTKDYSDTLLNPVTRTGGVTVTNGTGNTITVAAPGSFTNADNNKVIEIPANPGAGRPKPIVRKLTYVNATTCTVDRPFGVTFAGVTNWRIGSPNTTTYGSNLVNPVSLAGATVATAANSKTISGTNTKFRLPGAGAGTVSASGTTLTGVGTDFATTDIGRRISVGFETRTIVGVASATSATLDSPFNNSVAAASYTMDSDLYRAIKIDGEVRTITAVTSATSITVDQEMSATNAAATYEIGLATVKAALDGTVNAEFDIPSALIPSGDREVRFSNVSAGGSATARAVFRGQDVLRSRVAFAPNIRTVTEVVVVRDPVAQTFILSETRQLAGVRVFFKSKPAAATSNNGIEVEIRETIAGLPVSDSPIARTRMTADDPRLLTSSNADLTKGTDFIFDSAVICQKDREYAIVVKTDVPDYEIWQAKVGQTTVNQTPQQLVDEQASTDGVLLTSANARTWTPDQFADLMFMLLETVPAPTATAVFSFREGTAPTDNTFWNGAANVAVQELMLRAAGSVPATGSLRWEYSTDPSFSNVGQLDPNNRTTVPVLPNPSENIYVRAVMTNADREGCAISRQNLELTGIEYFDEGYYVTGVIFLAQAPTSLQVSLDVKKDGSVPIPDVEYAIFNNSNVQQGSWTSLGVPVSIVATQPVGFSTYTWSDSVSTPYTRIQFRIKLSSFVVGGVVRAVPHGRRLSIVIT